MNKEQKIVELVTIDSHYRRSVKLDLDYGSASGLGAYVCNRSARAVVEALARNIAEGNQFAFTITGPYGGGKSSLALILGSAIQEKEDLRKKASQRLDKETKALLKSAFPLEKGYLVVPVSGSKTNPVRLLSARLNEFCRKKIIEPSIASGSDLIDSLLRQAKSKKHDGLVLIIDELGKLLESAAQGDGDINFFQDLAEAAARSDGRLIVIGVLHQAFQQYVARLGSGFRTEWAKVQGRYVDIPLIAGADEVIGLIGRAIKTNIEHPWSFDCSKVVAETLKRNRAGLGDDIYDSLEDCWPMHPAMAVLLGPFSRRQYGQNERSVFGFLSSAEPHGFRHYLESVTNPKDASYKPSNFWDYLKSNLEPAILASADAHRWAQAYDAVSRVEAKGDSRHIEAIKTLAVIDLFKSGSGLEATTEVLHSSLVGISHKTLDKILDDLVDLRVAVYRKHKGSWAIFEGSDFDIDEEIQKIYLVDERSPVELVKQYISLQPIVAKRHYYETGALRWMNIEVCDETSVRNICDEKDSLGTFALCLFSDSVDVKSVKNMVADLASPSIVLGVSSQSRDILESAQELSALIAISQTNHKLVGDAVARKEVNSRLLSVQAGLEEAIRLAISSSEWCINGDWKKSSSLSVLASQVADIKFAKAPSLKNELLNRSQISTNAVKARRELIYRMLRHEFEPDLGLSGWPAERGLYESVLAESGLHRESESGVWKFSKPNLNDPLNFLPLWSFFDSSINDSHLENIGSLYEKCKVNPFGVKSGLLPVMLFAYILANKNSVAIYKDKMFVAQLTEADLDEFLKSPARFDLRSVDIDATKSQQLKNYVEVLNKMGKPLAEITPLSVARGLVSIAFQLPEWSRRTRKLSVEATNLRDLLLRASDPHKLLFIDIPKQLSPTNERLASKIAADALAELDRCYSVMLSNIEEKLFYYLEALPLNLQSLQARADTVEGVSGDFRLNAFASRIRSYDGSLDRLEGILSLAANKPPKTWSDSDIDNALLELTGWATRFRQVEALANVQGRKPTREAFAVVIGSAGSTKSLMRNFDISTEDKTKAVAIANLILDVCKKENATDTVALAALALAGIDFAEVENG